MIRSDAKAIEAINTYLAVLDRIQAEHKPVWMERFHSDKGALPEWFRVEHSCGTACCVAGWAVEFGMAKNRAQLSVSAAIFSDEIISKVSDCMDGSRDRYWNSLFGGGRDNRFYSVTGRCLIEEEISIKSQEELMASLNKVANWYKFRMERINEWEENNRKPKRERVDHMPSVLESMPI